MTKPKMTTNESVEKMASALGLIKPTPTDIAVKALGLMRKYYATCYTDTEVYADSRHITDVHVEALDDEAALTWVNDNRTYFLRCAHVLGHNTRIVVYLYDNTDGAVGDEIGSPSFFEP